MSGVIKELSSSIADKSNSWGDVASAAGIGVAAALLFGGPLGWIIGGGTLLYNSFFGKKETEEEKRQKVMSAPLDQEKRMQIVNGISEKWDEITNSIHRSVFDSLRNNSKARRDVSSAVDNLMAAYRDAIQKSRIMVD